MPVFFRYFVTLILLVAAAVPVRGQQPLRLILPTSNEALFEGAFEDFYQYTDRTFRGVRSRPWQGGQYGFVRNQTETSAGIVYTRFHEGVDIKPRFRNRAGEPLDTVRSVDAGRVVYVNANARGSSYGKYVVVEHVWSSMPFYSLYAHLGSTRVRTGDRVRQGDMLGVVGYTGRGINKRRAHVHFEINMLLNESFGRWHDAYFRGQNRHGVYNGMNMAGLDVAALYLELNHDSTLTIERFLRRQTPFYRIRIPNEGALDLHFRYPWLSAGGYDASAPSLEVSFGRSGLPLSIESSDEPVADATVIWAEPVNTDYSYLTNRMLSGSYTPALANSGQRYLHLITTNARYPGDDVHLAGRLLPLKVASQPVAPVVGRPPVKESAAAPAARGGEKMPANEVAAEPSDAESAGGEVRGW